VGSANLAATGNWPAFVVEDLVLGGDKESSKNQKRSPEETAEPRSFALGSPGENNRNLKREKVQVTALCGDRCPFPSEGV